MRGIFGGYIKEVEAKPTRDHLEFHTAILARNHHPKYLAKRLEATPQSPGRTAPIRANEFLQT